MRFSILFILVFSVFALNANAQKGLREHEEARVVLKKGKEQTGVIELRGFENSPWSIQKQIVFVEESLLTKEKIKRRDKEKYGPKDLVGFYLGDRYFESNKYSDMSAVGFNMLPQNFFIEKLVDGKISIYRFYVDPAPAGTVTVGEEAIKELERYTIECRNNPQYLIRKEGSKKMMKLRNVSDIDIYKYISDCESTLAKYKEGAFGNEPIDKDEKKGVKKFLAKTLDANGLRPFIIEIATDYNQCESVAKNK